MASLFDKLVSFKYYLESLSGEVSNIDNLRISIFSLPLLHLENNIRFFISSKVLQ